MHKYYTCTYIIHVHLHISYTKVHMYVHAYMYIHTYESMIYTREQSTCTYTYCPHLQHCRAVLPSLTVYKLSNQAFPTKWRTDTFSQQKFPQLGRGSWDMGRAVWPHLQPESGATQRLPYHLSQFQVDMDELYNRMSLYRIYVLRGEICSLVILYSEYEQVDVCK